MLQTRILRVTSNEPHGETVTEFEVPVVHPALGQDPAVMTVTAIRRDTVKASAPYTETINLTNVVALELGETTVPPAGPAAIAPALAAVGPDGAHIAEVPIGAELSVGEHAKLVQIEEGVFRVEPAA